MCKMCSSGSQIELKSEICLHRRAGFEKPAIFIFPKIAICLQCGFAEFVMSDKELLQIRNAAEQDMGSTR
jgi:hypothetical protein